MNALFDPISDSVCEMITEDFIESFTDSKGEPQVDAGAFFRLICKHKIPPKGLNTNHPKVKEIIEAACKAGGWDSPYVIR